MRLFKIIALLIWITVFTATCGGGNDNTTSTATVSGTVYDANGAVVEDAQVTISSDPVTTTTDQNGWFSIEVEQGDHEITITKYDALIYSGNLACYQDVSIGDIHADFAVILEERFDDVGEWELYTETSDEEDSAMATIQEGYLDLLAQQDCGCALASAHLNLVESQEINNFTVELFAKHIWGSGSGYNWLNLAYNDLKLKLNFWCFGDFFEDQTIKIKYTDGDIIFFLDDEVIDCTDYIYTWDTDEARIGLISAGCAADCWADGIARFDEIRIYGTQ